MFDKTPEWVASCQTYEGGFAALPGECRSRDPCNVIRSCDPGTEAHGGYTFCGFAALVLLGKPHLCDVNKLLVSCV